MSIPAFPSPRPPIGTRGITAAQLPEQAHRRANRLTIASGVSLKGDIIHVDIFLGSPPAVSELLVASLVEKLEENGAVVMIKYLDSFHPDRLTAANSIYRSSSRVIIFILSTHMGGKPSPNAERFLKWLEQVPNAQHAQSVDSLKSEELQITDVAAIFEPSAQTELDKHRNMRPNQQAKSQTSKESRQASLRIRWRNPFGGANPSPVPSKPLQGLNYTVFGIGNSIYRSNFNSTATFVDTKLYELGAVRTCPIGLGDVAKNIDSTFAIWAAQLVQVHYDQRGAPEAALVKINEALSPELSLPKAVSNKVNNSAGRLAGEIIMKGPTTMDLEGCALLDNSKQEAKQRRHSSAIAILRKHRVTSPSVTSMPPLSTRK